METYKKELYRITAILESFYTAKFTSNKKEYEANKINKERIGQLLIRIKQNQHLSKAEQQCLVNEALILLAKNNGSAEDSETTDTAKGVIDRDK